MNLTDVVTLLEDAKGQPVAVMVCPECRLRQRVQADPEREGCGYGCCDDVLCASCGHRWRVEWPD